MKTKRIKSRGPSRRNLPEVLFLAALVAWTSPSLLAQTTAPAADETKKDKDKDETVVLSPFSVAGTKDNG